jgi:hypothetical protein
MASEDSRFSSEHPWQKFAESFRYVVGSRKPTTTERMAGLELQFNPAAELSNGAFGELDRASGVAFDVIAGVFGRNGHCPSSVRLTLEETREGGTHGAIHFDHAVGAGGKNLGELTQRSVREVDGNISF